jgi:hypothetical protein
MWRLAATRAAETFRQTNLDDTPHRSQVIRNSRRTQASNDLANITVTLFYTQQSISAAAAEFLTNPYLLASGRSGRHTVCASLPHDRDQWMRIVLS